MPRPNSALLNDGFYTLKKNAGDGKCWVKGCIRDSRPDRCLCHMHEMRRWRAKHKKVADYCTLRDHARARGIDFGITLDYWRGVVDAYCFYEPREDEICTIDRIDATAGYVEGNIRVVSLALNAFKSNRERYLPEHVQHMLDRRRTKARGDLAEHLAMRPEEEPELWDDGGISYSEPDGDDNPF